MATSAIAFGKARVARNKGVPVPEGVLIDEHGRPTTDPTTYVDTRRGALLAFGAHKGSGLAILSEVLGAAVTGGATIAPHHERQDGILNSMLSFILDAAALGDPAHIAARDRGGRRLGQGLAAGAGLRRDPAARRARAARPRSAAWPRACRSTTRAWPTSWPPSAAWASAEAELDRALGR